MAEPVHRQFLLMRIPWAAREYDLMHVGLNQQRTLRKYQWREQQDEETRRKSKTVVELDYSRAVRGDEEHKQQSGEHPYHKHQKKQVRKKVAKDQEEYLNDLPRRRAEDDYGKGENLDIKG